MSKLTNTDEEDETARAEVLQGVEGDPQAMEGIAETGWGGVDKSFEFEVMGVGKFLADPSNKFKGISWGHQKRCLSVDFRNANSSVWSG
jgi:hypothetical protein